MPPQINPESGQAKAALECDLLAGHFRAGIQTYRLCVFHRDSVRGSLWIRVFLFFHIYLC